MKSDALNAMFKSVPRHPRVTPTLLRAVPAARADDEGDWDALIARAKRRAAPPPVENEGDWDALIARAKRRAAPPPGEDEGDWDALIARAKRRAGS